MHIFTYRLHFVSFSFRFDLLCVFGISVCYYSWRGKTKQLSGACIKHNTLHWKYSNHAMRFVLKSIGKSRKGQSRKSGKETTPCWFPWSTFNFSIIKKRTLAYLISLIISILHLHYLLTIRRSFNRKSINLSTLFICLYSLMNNFFFQIFSARAAQRLHRRRHCFISFHELGKLNILFCFCLFTHTQINDTFNVKQWITTFSFWSFVTCNNVQRNISSTFFNISFLIFFRFLLLMCVNKTWSEIKKKTLYNLNRMIKNEHSSCE